MRNDTLIPSLTLNNGVSIPQVGLGVFQVPEADTQRIVETALEAGYRHIDTAAAYYNEAGVGAALRAAGLPREDVFVTTKLRNGDQGHDAALAAFESSRRALGVDVVDLYLIHWPVPAKDLYVETWRAFEKLLADGAVRAIGVSNFLPEHLRRLVAETDVLPAVNQVEVHPTFQQRGTLAATDEAGVAVEAYSPSARAATSGPTPSPGSPRTAASRPPRSSCAGTCSRAGSSSRSPRPPSGSPPTSTCSASSWARTSSRRSTAWTPTAASAPTPRSPRSRSTGDRPPGRGPGRPPSHARSSRGTAGSARRAGWAWAAARTSLSMAGPTSSTLTFMPATTRPSATQKARNFRAPRSPR